MFRNYLIAVVVLALIAMALMPALVNAGGKSDAAASLSSNEHTVEGTVTFKEIDGTIIITPESGNRLIVYAREDTKIARNQKPATLADLRSGDKIWAKYASDHAAIEIRATGP